MSAPFGGVSYALLFLDVRSRNVLVHHRRCIEHRLTKPDPPWTHGQADGQAERMDRTIEDVTVKVSHHDDPESLKALRWTTPFQTICQAWTTDPDRFRIDPHHLIPGPYTSRARPEIRRKSIRVDAVGPVLTGRKR